MIAIPLNLRHSVARSTFGHLPSSALKVVARPLPCRHSNLPTAHFSTSVPFRKTVTRDNNRHRGVSPLRRSGLREPVSVSNVPLPKPSDYQPVVETDPNHGLWGFFPESGKLMRTPEEESNYGRSWTMEELRAKDWQDLHSLWWVCCKERNLISTANLERKRSKMGFGSLESQSRDKEVLLTMKRIRSVLTERYYVWEDARKLAQNDPEINLSGQGPAYNPLSHSQYDDVFVQEEQSELSDTATSETPAALSTKDGKATATPQVA